MTAGWRLDTLGRPGVDCQLRAVVRSALAVLGLAERGRTLDEGGQDFLEAARLWAGFGSAATVLSPSGDVRGSFGILQPLPERVRALAEALSQIADGEVHAAIGPALECTLDLLGEGEEPVDRACLSVWLPTELWTGAGPETGDLLKLTVEMVDGAWTGIYPAIPEMAFFGTDALWDEQVEAAWRYAKARGSDPERIRRPVRWWLERRDRRPWDVRNVKGDSCGLAFAVALCVNRQS
jgi:hypothetical protein